MARKMQKDIVIVIIILLVGKAFGFLRELVVAYYYGATYQTDAFYFVNDLIFTSFSLIAASISTGFVPTYLTIEIKRDSLESQLFANRLLNIMLVIGLIICSLLICFASAIIKFTAPGFNEQTSMVAVNILKLMAPTVLLHISFNIRKGILNAHKKYFVTESAGIPYSISLVVLTIALSKWMGIYALAISAIIGLALQNLLVYIYSSRLYKYKLAISFKDNDIFSFLALIVPITIGTGIQQINNLIAKVIASGLSEGSIASINYSNMLVNLINGLFVYSITTVLFPSFIEDINRNQTELLINKICNSLNTVSVVLVPTIMFGIIFRIEIIRIIYERGAFGREDTLTVALLFAIYLTGCLFFGWREVLRKVFYSYKDSKTPMINAAISIAINIILNIILVRYLGIYALALSSVISVAIATPFLFSSLYKHTAFIQYKSFMFETFKSIIASLITAVVLIITRNLFNSNNIYIIMFIYLFFTIMIYTTSMFFFRSTSVHYLLRAIKDFYMPKIQRK